MENLTKEELYTMELALDAYAGFVNEALQRYCKISVEWEGSQVLVQDKDKRIPSPLIDSIKELAVTRKHLKQLRHKLEYIRTGKMPDLEKEFLYS